MYQDNKETREAICDVGLRLWTREMVASNDGNISVLLDNDTVLTTPTGISKGRMRPEDLVIVSRDGKHLEGTKKASSEVKMHLRIYRDNPEINAVVHAHPMFATMYAVLGETPPCDMLTETVVLMPELPLAPYAMPSTEQVPDSIAPLINTHRACLLEHHGALAWDVDLESAYMSMERLEYVSKMGMLTRLTGERRSLGEKRIADLNELFGLK